MVADPGKPDKKGVLHMHKYMTIHTTESGDHANFFSYYSNAYDFFKDMHGMGYVVCLYKKDVQGVYRPIVAFGLEDD